MGLLNTYFCHVIGEDASRFPRLHPSTVKRIKAIAIAIHIPVLLWAVTGYVIAASIFNTSTIQSIFIAAFSATLIFMIERIVIATPKTWYVNVGRIFIGLIIAILGASTFDLVIFEKEIQMQLQETQKLKILDEFGKAISEQSRLALQRKSDWMSVQQAANCEANGTCGSQQQNLGPIYIALASQADFLKNEYLVTEHKIDDLVKQRDQKLSYDPEIVINQAGLLARIEALHQYTMQNPAAMVAWTLFFLLILSFELMVVLSKLVFGETVDDEIDRIREQVSQDKANRYLNSMTSSTAASRSLLQDAYN
jgi:hypothetical protein